jgi:hypothetical protein
MVTISDPFGDLGWVTLFKHHEVAIVDLETGKIVDRVKQPRDMDAGLADALSDAGLPDAKAADLPTNDGQRDAGPDAGDPDGPPTDAVSAPDGGVFYVGASAVEQISYGQGAGFGQSAMPGVILEGPQGDGAGGGSLDVLSLGQSGQVILSFGPYDIVDGPGPDFIVFENPFLNGPYQPFAEPAIVSLSTMGTIASNFTDFPCDLTVTTGDPAKQIWPYPGCAGVKPVLANVKTNSIPPNDPVQAGGDAFDLSTISFKQARYLRIKDAGLSLTGNTSRGFDLDAVVLINYKKVR